MNKPEKKVIGFGFYPIGYEGKEKADFLKTQQAFDNGYNTACVEWEEWINKEADNNEI